MDVREQWANHVVYPTQEAGVPTPRLVVIPDHYRRLYGPLLEYTTAERETLVIKPNRAFGGEGVVIGPSVTQEEWDAAVARALADEEPWVVQQLASIPVNEFPVLGPDGKTHVEPFYTVMGFAATKYGLAILGRASQKQVVNVAQRGGMCAVMIGRPPERLIGPASLTA